MIGERESHIQYVNDIDKLYKLDKINPDSNIDEYLNYSRAELKKLSQQDCAEISYLISCYSLYLKKEENKYMVLCSRIKSALDQIIFKEISNYCDDPKFVKYEEKVILVCFGNDAARELKSSLDNFNSSKEYLSYLSTSLLNISNTLNEIRKSKYEHKKG